MKTSMDKIIRNALKEMGIKAVETEGKNCTIFSCNYMFVNIEIRAYDITYVIIYTYSCLKNILDENLNNLFKFFSLINGYGGVGATRGLVFNVNLFDDNHYVFSSIYVHPNSNAIESKDPESDFYLKSKYYKDLKEQFMRIYLYKTTDAFTTYPYILAVLNEADPKTIWKDWRKRELRDTSLLKIS